MDPRGHKTHRTEDAAHDSLTRLGAAVLAALESHPEADGSEKCAVFIQRGDRGGIALHGYDDDTEALVDLLLHLKAIMNSQGKDLLIVAQPGDIGHG